MISRRGRGEEAGRAEALVAEHGVEGKGRVS